MDEASGLVVMIVAVLFGIFITFHYGLIFYAW